MSFLQLIVLILALYLFFRIFASYLAPWLLKLFIRRIQNRFFEQNPDANPNVRQQKGKVTIHRMNKEKENEIPPDLGDYIDYEEVKNNQTPTNEKD